MGVTLTIGEVLDPLNDLVENFAWLALLASVSLGTQLLLADVVANLGMNGLLTAAAAGYLAARCWPGSGMLRVILLRAFVLALFARFLFALVSLLVVFTVQTILVPVAALFLAYRLFLGLWRWSWRGAATP